MDARPYDSPQGKWLRADLEANPAACTLVIWHHPLFSSSSQNEGDRMIGIWRMLSGAAVVGACWWAKRDEYRMTLRDFLMIAGASLLFTAPPQVIQAYVLEQGFGPVFFGTMVAAIPLLTILVSVPMLGVRPQGR